MTQYNIEGVEIEGVVAYLDDFDRKPRFRFTVNWCGDRGFGEIAIVYKPDTDEFFIDSELMSRQFVKAVLCKMVDRAFVRGEPPNYNDSDDIQDFSCEDMAED